MTTREELETEAAELYPLYDEDRDWIKGNGHRQEGYIRAKTITAEQVLRAVDRIEDDLPELTHDEVIDLIEAAFRAAGFYVEEPAT